MSQTSITNSASEYLYSHPQVLNLAEAAEFLRLAESEVSELTREQSLPGRKVGDQWRFLKSGLVEWLLQPSPSKRILRHAGALPDAQDAQSIIEQSYLNRNRNAENHSE